MNYRHLKHEHETLKVQNEIQWTQNVKTLLHISLWYDKNKKLKDKKKSLKRKAISLKYKILLKKPRMAFAKKEVKKRNLDVLAHGFGVK